MILNVLKFIKMILLFMVLINWPIHDQRLIALLRRLLEKNMTVNRSRCSFCVSSFECLGYLVDGIRFTIDIQRLSSLTNAPSQKKLTELRPLVGALQYYFRFIPNFSYPANCVFSNFDIQFI